MYSYTTQVDLIIKIHVDSASTHVSIILLKFVKFEIKCFTTC